MRSVKSVDAFFDKVDAWHLESKAAPTLWAKSLSDMCLRSRAKQRFLERLHRYDNDRDFQDNLMDKIENACFKFIESAPINKLHQKCAGVASTTSAGLAGVSLHTAVTAVSASNVAAAKLATASTLGAEAAKNAAIAATAAKAEMYVALATGGIAVGVATVSLATWYYFSRKNTSEERIPSLLSELIVDMNAIRGQHE